MTSQPIVKPQLIHLQKQFSDKLTAEERDVLRADMVRDRLKNVGRPKVKTSEAGLDKPSDS